MQASCASTSSSKKRSYGVRCLYFFPVDGLASPPADLLLVAFFDIKNAVRSELTHHECWSVPTQ